MKSVKVLGVSLVITLGLITWWAYPKQHVCVPTSLAGLNSPAFVSYYRGFGFTDGNSLIWGKQYYLIKTFWSDGFYCETRYEGPGYNDFRRFYPNGGLAEQGRCFVDLLFGIEPIPDEDNVEWSKCYKPDGSLGSEVLNGTGKITYWTPQGSRREQVELDHFRTVRRSYWYPNGQLSGTAEYVDGLEDGPYVSYYQSGAKRTEGAYSKADRVGKWLRYNEDGSISEIEDYTVEPK
ncbi:MAG: toxin-antitoxin system YwqK family antitoxin [Planctomycetota bacterium]|jgi:hypothetical protein